MRGQTKNYYQSTSITGLLLLFNNNNNVVQKLFQRMED